MSYKVAVLMGGTSKLRDLSIVSGKRALEALEAAGHETIALDTTPDLVETLRRERPDAVYSALLGQFGEDGSVQDLMDLLGIPLVGSTGEVCRQTWNKAETGIMLRRFREGAREGELGAASVPAGICISRAAFEDMGADQALDLVAGKIAGGFPLAVKPVHRGAALGMSKVERESELGVALRRAFEFDDQAIVEEWVEGVQLSVGILGEAADSFALPPVEIVPQQGRLFDAQAREETGLVDFHAPVRLASLSPDEANAQAIRSEVERAAIEVHRAYGARDLSRVDLIWDGARARVLEIDVAPALAPRSTFPLAVEAAGLSLEEVLNALVEHAVSRA